MIRTGLHRVISQNTGQFHGSIPLPASLTFVLRCSPAVTCVISVRKPLLLWIMVLTLHQRTFEQVPISGGEGGGGGRYVTVGAAPLCRLQQQQQSVASAN